jgi:hypothetical protein
MKTPKVNHASARPAPGLRPESLQRPPVDYWRTSAILAFRYPAPIERNGLKVLAFRLERALSGQILFRRLHLQLCNSEMVLEKMITD